MSRTLIEAGAREVNLGKAHQFYHDSTAAGAPLDNCLNIVNAGVLYIGPIRGMQSRDANFLRSSQRNCLYIAYILIGFWYQLTGTVYRF